MRKAILYIRVSTDEQADKGYSLKHQEERLYKFCEMQGYEVVEIFKEDYSAKTFNRPEFNRLLNYVKKLKIKPDLLLFTKWDRFSRNTGDAYGMINTMNKLGIDPQAIEQPLDLTIPENKIMLAFYLAAPEVENDRRALNVFVGMRRAKKEGRWMATAPRGYKNITTDDGRRIIIPSDDAPIFKWAFEQLATGQFHIDEIRKRCNEKGMKCGKDNFWQLVKNPVYCGKLIIPAYKDEEQTIVKGIHEPIISEELFNNVQDVLAGKRRLAYSCKTKEEFPLRGFLTCPSCGKNLTASISRGGSGNRHYYYHCIKGCKERHKAFDLHDQFSEILKNIRFDEEPDRLYHDITKEVFRSKADGKSASKGQIQAEIQKNKDRINNAQQMMLDGVISAEEYREVKKRYEPIVDKLLKEYLDSDNTDSMFRSYLKKGLSLVKNLDTAYNRGTVKEKQAVLRSILKKNLKIENSEVRTEELNETFSLIAAIDGNYRAKKKRTEAKILQLSAVEVPSELNSNSEKFPKNPLTSLFSRVFMYINIQFNVAECKGIVQMFNPMFYPYF